MNLTFLGLLFSLFWCVTCGRFDDEQPVHLHRQPEIIGQLRGLWSLVLPLSKGTFFVTLVMAFIIK